MRSGRQPGIRGNFYRAIREGRVLQYDKTKRADLPVNAQTVSLSIITASALNQNIARFRKEVNTFRRENRIDYSRREP